MLFIKFGPIFFFLDRNDRSILNKRKNKQKKNKKKPGPGALQTQDGPEKDNRPT